MKAINKDGPRLCTVLLLGFTLLGMMCIYKPDRFTAPYRSFFSYQHEVQPASQHSRVKQHFGEELAEKKESSEMLSCNYQDFRFDICEMKGDIRINGKSSHTFFIISDQSSSIESNKSWKIRPHPRKFEGAQMSHVREIEIKTLIKGDLKYPKCDVNHEIPVVIFSLPPFPAKHENYYHSFVDVLVPIFITSSQFKGEVQLMVSFWISKWIDKFKIILNNLSRYEIIDFDKEEKTHCYPHVIVGSHRHSDLTIDPSRSPKNHTMVDFGIFIRNAFSLERGHLLKYQENIKPRLLVIARSRTRKFVNIDSIILLGGELGFEVVASEVPQDVNEAAHFINSFDVIMGVHGSGLTNLIFLPTKAVVIQIVPYGNLEYMSFLDFGPATMDMDMRYFQYSISVEESTLIEEYGRDDPVFTDPDSIHEKGWDFMERIYLIKQNVRLDVTRFRPTLVEALQHLKYLN